MEDPVISADGHTYDRAQIERWLRDQATSPITGEQELGAQSQLLCLSASRLDVCLFTRVPVGGFEPFEGSIKKDTPMLPCVMGAFICNLARVLC